MGWMKIVTRRGGRPYVTAALSLLSLACAGIAGGCQQIQAGQAAHKAEAAYEDQAVGWIRRHYKANLELGKQHIKNREDPEAYPRYCLALAAQTREIVREMDAAPPPPGYEAVHQTWHTIFSDSAATHEAMGTASDSDTRSQLFRAWQARRDVQTKTAEREMKAVAARQEAAGRTVNDWFKRWRG